MDYLRRESRNYGNDDDVEEKEEEIGELRSSAQCTSSNPLRSDLPPADMPRMTKPPENVAQGSHKGTHSLSLSQC